MDRKQPPLIKDAVAYKIVLPDYEQQILKNGIPVFKVPSYQQETLQIEWVFDAGSWYEPAPLVAIAVSGLLKSGTRSKTSFQINETIEYHGAFLSTSCSYETVSVTLHCLSAQLNNLLPVIHEILTESVFPEAELELYKQNRKQKLAVNLIKSDFVANREIDRLIYGIDHPYGRYSTAEAYDALSSEVLLKYYKAHYTYNHCKIFVAGNIPSDLEDNLNRFFGGSFNGNGGAKEPVFDLNPSEDRFTRISVGGEKSVQGAVRIGRAFPDKYHPDIPGMQILNTILGEYFGSRLMRNIREEKGYTYGVYSSLYLYRHAGSFIIQTEAGRDVCEAVVAESFKEMQILCNDKITEEELHLVRNYLIGNLLAGLDGCFKVVGYWKNLILSGFDKAHFYHSVEVIKNIQAAELQALAVKYFKPEDFYTLIAL